MDKNLIDIFGRMVARTVEGILAGSDQIMDDNQLEKQSSINARWRYIENEEYLAAWVDSNDRLLFGIRRDGRPYFPANEMYRIVQNEEYLYALVDATDKLLFGIRSDGEIIEGKVPLNTRKALEKLREDMNRNVLAISMDRETGRLIGYTGNDSNIRDVRQNRVTGKISIIQTIK